MTRYLPVGAGHIVTSPYGWRGSEFHTGIDFGWPGGNSGGRPVYAVQSGTVKYWGPAQGYGGPDPAGWLVIDSDDSEGGGCFEYGHIVREVQPREHVQAGQRIAHINPDRNTNAGVDPHLHLSFMPYEYNRDKKIDPTERLTNAIEPDDTTVVAGLRSTSASALIGGPTMTIYGPDISNHQGAVDISQVVREGFQFLFAKVSEGDYYSDPFWPATRDSCQSLGLTFAGYHYVTTNDPDSQADLFVSQLGDNSIPAMLDFEHGSGNIDNFWAVLHAIESRGVRVRLSYIPRWYWDQIGRPDISDVPALIQSHYVGYEGYASATYPGDNSDYWQGFGGRDVDILQFTDKALIAGQKMDANAYRGSVDDLRGLLGLDPIGQVAALAPDLALLSAPEPPNPFRPLDDGAATLPWTIGQSLQILLVERLAVTYGDPYSIALLEEVASAGSRAKKEKYPDRQRDAELATLILAKVPKTKRPTAQGRKPS